MEGAGEAKPNQNIVLESKGIVCMSVYETTSSFEKQIALSKIFKKGLKFKFWVW